MNIALRTGGIAGTLSLALSAAAGAATVRLLPLDPPAIGASVQGCAATAKPASIAEASPADIPTIAAEQHVGGVTEVRISIDRSGRLIGESVLKGSGNRWLDRAALTSARLSQYNPEVRGCERVAGTYAFVVDFTRE